MSEEPAPTEIKPLTKTRLEAFSDGVVAIIITIMVLELKTPEKFGLDDLMGSAHVFLLYAFSFIYIGIYWNNHHHLLHAAQKITGGVLWANMHLLFWLSLVPFATRWMGESWSNGHLEQLPVAVYGLSLLMPSIAFYILARVLIAANGRDSALNRAIGKDAKGLISTAIYIAGIALTWWSAWAAVACYLAVALIWLVPDRRIERN